MNKVLLIFRKANPAYFSIEKVFALCLPGIEKEFEVSVAALPAADLKPGSLLRNLRAGLSFRGDVLHVTGDTHYLVAALPRNKTVLTIHDTVFMESNKGFRRALLRWMFLKYPVSRCRYVTAISEATKNDIIRYTGCRPDKIQVIPDPANPAFFYQPKTFNTEKPSILQIGTWPNKNLERLAEALQGIPCRLMVIGKLSQEQRFLLDKNKIEYGHLFGISEQDLIAQYAAADIVFFASTFEGFGLPVLEAQATGRALVTSQISPMKEVAGEGACLVDPFDVQSIRNGILRIIEDEVFRNRLIEQGLENVKKYAPDVIAGQYCALYRKVISNP